MEKQTEAPRPPLNISNVAKYLRSSSSGLKNRQGVLNGKRVDYFKGNHKALYLQYHFLGFKPSIFFILIR